MDEDIPHHPSSEFSKLLAETDWADLTKRLLLYARYRFSRHGSASGRYGNKPDDYVQEAVAAFLAGRRQFSLSHGKTLFEFLCGVIDSLLSHDAEKAERRGPQLFIGNDASGEAAPDEYQEDRLASDVNFEQDIIVKEELEHFVRLLDPDLQAYVRLRAEGIYSTAEECAATLCTTVGDIRNMDRKLRRRREQWSA